MLYWRGNFTRSHLYIWRTWGNPLFITTLKAAGALLEWPDLKEGISPGSPYIQMRPAEVPFSIQLLKIQEPLCPPFQKVSLFLTEATLHWQLCSQIICIHLNRRNVNLRTSGPPRLTIWKRGQRGSCIFNSCIEKGISAGVVCIYGKPGEIPSSSEHLKLQVPCPALF